MYKTNENEYDNCEVFYNEYYYENSDYLPNKEETIIKFLEHLYNIEEKIRFKFDREVCNDKKEKLLLRLEKINKRGEELNDWRKLKFPRNK